MAERAKVRKLTMRKYGGDDIYSWAVFEKGNPNPIVTGCSQREARYHKEQIERNAERGAR